MPEKRTPQPRAGPVSRKREMQARDFSSPLATEIKDTKDNPKRVTESDKFSRTLLNSAPNPIVVTNIDTSVRYVNPAFEALTGYTKTDVIGCKSPYPWWPRDIAPRYHAENLPGRQVAVNVLERTYRKKNGELLSISLSISPVYQNGQPSCFISNWTDMTQYRRSEDERMQRREELETIFQAMGEGIILWNKDLRIEDANAEAERIFGLARDQLRGRAFRVDEWSPPPAWERIRPDGLPMPDEETAGFLAWESRHPVRDVEIGHRFEDGNVVWLNTSALPISDREGNVRNVLCTFADITEQKRIRDEREYYLSQAINSQEEERKRISRELHDDIVPSLSLLAMDMDAIVEKQPGTPPETIAALERMRATTRNLVQRMRQASHDLYPSVLENMGLAEALSSLVSEVAERCAIDIDFSCSGFVRPLTTVTERALFRITQEALNNILKHSGASQASVTMIYSAQRIRLMISDNGKGFSVVEKSREAIGKGSLGLLSMRERASLIKATFKIDSSPEHGTMVHVELRQKN